MSRTCVCMYGTYARAVGPEVTAAAAAEYSTSPILFRVAQKGGIQEMNRRPTSGCRFARANDGEIAAEDDFVVVGAFQAEVLRHFAQANSADDEDLGALEDEDGDFEAYLEDLDLDEVDDEEFERLLALAEEEEEFVDIDGEDFDKLLL